MKKTDLIFLLILTTLVFVCTTCTHERNPGGFEISGVVLNGENERIVLEEITPENRIKIDSTILDKEGRFKFSWSSDQPGIFALTLPSKGLITFYADEGSKIRVSADFKSLPGKYKIEGNKGSGLLHEYFTKILHNQLILDSLSSVFANSQYLDNFYEIKTSLDSSFAQLFREQKEFTIKLIHENPTEIVSLLLLNQYFGNTRLLNPENNNNIFNLLDSSLMALYPENKHVKSHHLRVNDLKEKIEEEKKTEDLLGKGKPAPEISLPDHNGKIMPLSTFKGKTVLLFFWASWSVPGRAAMQQLKQFYHEKNDPDFQVLAISLDHNEKFWKAAINIEQTPWINVSDLRGLYSPVKKLYNVPDDLPYFYLIDNEGKILDKSAKLSEILKNFR